MNRWIGLVLFILLGFLFLAANRSARRGFFAGDELDSIGWTPQVPLATFARELVSPVYNRRNFRPVGHLYFRVMSRSFGLHFADYVWPLHVLHLLNAWLLWLVLRRLGVSPYAATAGALFFGFHMAVFDVYWKPMYVFDLLCATFSLASLLCWIERRWLLAFVAFWLAYKSKELAVMLPAVLAAYEYWIGPRRWRPLIPFCAASLAFGLQGVILNPNTDNDYAFRFTPGAVLASVRFYAAALCGVPSLGLALLPLPAIWRDRRLWLGASTTALFFVPLIFLPGRLYSAYWYLPLTGLAIVLASLANGRAGWIVAVFLAAWLPANYLALRDYGPRKLRADAPVRAYVQQLETAAPALRHTSVFLYRNLPSALPPWGVGGALRFLLPAIEVGVFPLEAPPAAVFQRDSSVAMLTWDETSRNLWITPEATYIAMNELTPVWQLTSGWYALEKGFCWTAPWATARLYRAPIARQFEVVLNVGPQALLAQGYTESSVWLDGMRLGTIRSTAPGIRTARWPIPRGSAGSAAIEFRTAPPSQSPRDPRVLGAAVISFGFLPSGR